MKKIIKILSCIIILFSIIGCGNNKEKEEVTADMKKVSIYKSSDTMGVKESETPILVIDYNEGLILFENLIDNSKQMEGMLNMVTPSYIAEIQYSDTSEVIYFSLYTSGGMYVNSKDTSIGYRFELKDIEAFMNVYKEYIEIE